MYDAVNIETGEIVRHFEGFEYRWYDDGKRRVKKLLKELGYEVVKVELKYSNMVVWVREVKTDDLLRDIEARR